MEKQLISVTIDGIPVAIDNSRFGDYRVLRAFRKMQDGDAIALSLFIDTVFGEEQVDNICKSLGTWDDSVLFDFTNRAISAAAAEMGGDLKN